MDVSRELLSRELGQIALAALDGLVATDIQNRLAEQDSVRILQKIQDILNDESLDDFSCVEGIVLLFEEYGLSTFRHDFG